MSQMYPIATNFSFFLVASNVLLSPGRQNILSYATGTTSGHIVDIVRASLLSTEGGGSGYGINWFHICDCDKDVMAETLLNWVLRKVLRHTRHC